MSLYTSTQSLTTNTVELYRLTGAAFRSAFTSAGFVRTTDTGQVSDWAAVTLPAYSTYPHYEIWRFDDELQSTNPVFLRVSYGRGPAGFSLKVIVGTGSNGSGAITNPSTEYTVVPGTSGTIAGALDMWSLASDGSGFVIHAGSPSDSSSTYRRFIFSVERTRSVSGESLEHGILLNWLTASPNYPVLLIFNYHTGTWTTPPVGFITNPWPPAGVTSTGPDGIVYAKPFQWVGLGVTEPCFMKMVLLINAYDVIADTILEFPFLGDTRQYKTFGQMWTHASVFGYTGLTWVADV